MRLARPLARAAGLGLLCAGLCACTGPGSPPHAPDITVATVDGESLAFSGLRGRPVLVTFWATTCSSCIGEIPALVDLYRELSPRGLAIVAIAMHYDPPNRVLALREARQIPYTVALDIGADAARAFGDVRLTPTSFLVAPDGRIAYRGTGSLPHAKLRRDIIAMLEEADTAGRIPAG